jgi:hypothetical protein
MFLLPMEGKAMATLTVTGSGVLSPSARRKKPKLALRGRRRKGVRKLLNALRVVQSQDQTEATKAEHEGYIPYLFRMPGTKPTEQDYARVIARCNEALRATI